MLVTLLAVLTLPRRVDFFAAFFAVAARLVPALASAGTDLTLVFVLDFRLADAAFFRLVLRAFLARAGEAFDFERALERALELALDRAAVAALDLFDLLWAMMVAAGKGFRRASQSEVMI
ncbi:hypothetical protein [Pseudolabrys sp. FHR47]|uniref:hypothetical protein n=1 Tax=Pseudolabrys sp. FHR47 TaxID=2562284 RepID=UPI0010BEEA6A|nr:hypothetical protein [Pseudolabrys sp. FHR47]